MKPGDPCVVCRRPSILAAPSGVYCGICAERNADTIAQELREWRSRRIAFLRRFSEMGERFETRTFANYRRTAQNAAACDAAFDAWENGTGLYLWGNPGNGKTHLAGAIVNAAIDAQYEAIFVTSVTLLQRIRETYRKREGLSERSVIEHYATVRLLVIDDLGTENFTVDVGRLFYAVINRRYEQRGLKLIVTSNLSPADLVTQWGRSGVEPHIAHKIVDRIRELCDNRIVQITAPSERGHVA